MNIAVSGLSLRPGEGEERLPLQAAERLGIPAGRIRRWQLLKRSLDARGRREPRFVCTVGLSLSGGELVPDLPGVTPWRGETWQLQQPSTVPNARPLVVGAGPAGLFAALRLCRYGLKPIVLERGKPVDERVRDVARYWRDRVLDAESNVQFGEGGAGTFSDGKLTYRGKDFRKGWVFEELVAAGASEDILWEAKPHLGTDRLRSILRRLRATLLALGADLRFGVRVEGLSAVAERVGGVETTSGVVRGGPVFLAPGHSARDLYARLQGQGGCIETKGFAVGVRVEVPQALVDRCQYGRWADQEALPRAEFTAKTRAAGGRDVYSFCMCPGGVVIPAGTEPESVALNGMSAHGRSGRWANAALVVPVDALDWGGSSKPFGGSELQRDMEKQAWQAGQGRGVPAQSVSDFLAGAASRELGRSSCPWELVPADLRSCLPSFVADALRDALPRLAEQVPPLARGLLLGVETRTSSPIRIPRGSDLEALSWPGVYPIGEGPGHAGGIVSAAVDGARAADAWAAKLGGGVVPVREAEALG